MMKISIIVCAYNGEKDMPSCLASLVGQQGISPDEYEVLILDDGSTDQTGEVTKKFVSEQAGEETSFRYIRIEHQGLSIGRNTGLFLADAPIVAYMDQDAVADPCWVAQLVAAWTTHPDADVIGGKINVRNEESWVASFLHEVHYEPTSRSGVVGTNMSFRKARLLEVGAFGDPFVSRGDDTFVTLKMGPTRKEIIWPGAIVFHAWPTSLKKWLKERVCNGELARMISMILETKQNPCRKFIVHRAIAVLSVAVVVLLFSRMMEWVVLGFAGVVCLKIVRQGNYKRLRRSFSPSRAFGISLLWLPLKELGLWNLCRGWFRSSQLTCSKEAAMHGTVSDRYVVETFSNI